MAAHSYLGTWEVVECILQCNTGAGPPEKSGIEGTIMKLDESGDVSWVIASGAEDLPLFSCDTYDVFNITGGIFIRFGAYAGHIIEFKVNQPDPSDMMMTCDGWCLLHCKRASPSEPAPVLDSPFSFLPALEDGYFSDLSITASNNKKFAVHSCILKLCAPDLDWKQEPPPLTGLSEDVLGTILHYLYAECLPQSLNENTAHQCITAASQYPCLAPLVTHCEHYLRNNSLKQQMINLVTDMHNCASQIIQHFNTKHSSSASESLNSNPAKLCFIVRQSIQEAAVAGVKLLVLCDLFTKKKSELTREQRHEIIKYAKSRLPVFMNQLHRFLVGLKSTFSNMSPNQRQEIAIYLVPEIEKILETVSSLGVKVKTALEQMIPSFKEGHSTSHRQSLILTLKEVLQNRELSKLKSLLQRHKHSLHLLLQRKESFSEMTSGNKVRSVSRSLEQVIEELPVFLLRLEEVTNALDDRLEWREFKFCFKVGSSKVSGFMQKLVDNKNALKPVLNQLCDLVARDAFSQSLVTLGLLDQAPCSTATTTSTTTAPSKTFTHSTPKHHSYKLNLVEGLCVSPLSRNSRLSKAAIQLLKTGQDTDMVFEITPSQDAQECVSSPSTDQAVAATLPGNSPEEICSLKAHRVIVAARCDWFRRALLSGMREAIDRKIVVIDTSPSLFLTLVDYLYCGQLDTSKLTVDQLSDLLYAADRYEVDSLKYCCEQGLSSYIDHDTVLYFLSMSDQFNAKILRTSCLNFISLNPDIMDSDLFGELPQNLQAEVYDLVIWVNPRKCEKLSSPSSSLSRLAEEMTNVSVSNSSSMEDVPQDSARLEACLSQLRDVIGEGASRQELIELALAADYDLNRALNFFYSC
ncbi:uncharacterized protein LOC142323850 isoform X2 [Lycorma delicatula]|uniref:uncharacterized protein LOC142323850 isoform X2 n=1 Tax=Lycorma delicatula TaxID=130591 RepID=UPI003F51900A